MRTFILYDSMATHDNGVDWLAILLENLESDTDIQTAVLDCREIKPCIGCFGCWIKTPGNCVIKIDPVNDLARDWIHADQVILLTRVTYGGYSADTKSLIDRSIMNLSPFFVMRDGEMHHRRRYEHYPELVWLGYGGMTSEEAKTFTELAGRNAINLFPPRHLVRTFSDPEECIKAVQALNDFRRKE